MGRQPACTGERKNFVVEFAFLFKCYLGPHGGNTSQINRYIHHKVPGTVGTLSVGWLCTQGTSASWLAVGLG